MIDENLVFLRKAIAQLRKDLDIFLRLEAAIVRGDEEERLKILMEGGFKPDPELFPETKA